MELNSTNLRDLEFICLVAAHYFSKTGAEMPGWEQRALEYSRRFEKEFKKQQQLETETHE